MKLAFELSERDIRYFRKALRQSREAVRDAEEPDIIDAVRQALDQIRDNRPLPDFVAQRIPAVETMVDMLTDTEWHLPRGYRERLLAMFVYFSDPEDLLPDDLPVIGYLDDIIIIELIMRELQHVREAYGDFCRFRREYDAEHGDDVDPVLRRDRLDRRRQQLHQRMRRRSAKEKPNVIW